MRRKNTQKPLESPQNKVGRFGRVPGSGDVRLGVKHNPALHDFPDCLPVTDEEVTLLQRYLRRPILDLFS